MNKVAILESGYSSENNISIKIAQTLFNKLARSELVFTTNEFEKPQSFLVMNGVSYDTSPASILALGTMNQQKVYNRSYVNFLKY
tara:strand:+ start:4506 stop:4760 length:255 start_codon:yes stop_codon:yes gene_type:complete